MELVKKLVYKHLALILKATEYLLLLLLLCLESQFLPLNKRTFFKQ